MDNFTTDDLKAAMRNWLFFNGYGNDQTETVPIEVAVDRSNPLKPCITITAEYTDGKAEE